VTPAHTSPRLLRLQLPALPSIAFAYGHIYFVSQCLDVKDLKVITATVQRLPPHLIPPLLNLCIARIQARPSRAVQVLLQHLHFLTLSSPSTINSSF